MAGDEGKIGSAEIGDWAAAFAALDQEGKEDPKIDAGSGADTGIAAGTEDAGKEESAEHVGGNGNPDENLAGGLGADAGIDQQEDGEAQGDMFESVDDDIEGYRKRIEDDIRNQAIDEIAREFIKRGVRHDSHGRLGATLDDGDICKRDEDGVPHFYNPETGQEFRGDNPRRQAQEWVDDYNKELARVFNDACENYEQKLMENVMPQIAVREFAPKYNKLDPVRKGMFERIIAPYEIKDNDGDVIGYSCDLDSALDVVDSQISWIQEYAKENGIKAQPTGPALDMKTSSGAVQTGDQPAPVSLAEAMEREQDRLLENLRNKR